MELGIEYNGVASATIETCGLNLGDEDAAGQVGFSNHNLVLKLLGLFLRVQFS